jgi:hypothetical protein
MDASRACAPSEWADAAVSIKRADSAAPSVVGLRGEPMAAGGAADASDALAAFPSRTSPSAYSATSSGPPVLLKREDTADEVRRDGKRVGEPLAEEGQVKKQRTRLPA